MIGATSWRGGSAIRRARSAATKPTTSSSRWDIPGPTAPPVVRWLKSNPNGDWVIHGCTGPGSPSPGCGCSTTSATARWSAGRKIVLLVAWLAWCRYRVVIALRDRTAPSVFAGLDRIFRILGGAPTYLLTDNEKTVTTGHIAGVPVRNRARRHVRALLRHLGADLPARRPGIQGWGGERGQTRQGRHRAHRDEPAAAVRHLRRGRNGVLGVRRRDQRPRAPRHGPATRGDAHRRNAPHCTRCPTCRTPPPWG